MKTEWAKGLMAWHEQGRFCISIPFTWLLNEARDLCLSHPNECIVVGGPAVSLLPDFLAGIPNVEVGTIVPDDPLRRANPDASRTTFGCPNSCAFCGVRTIEGPYRELEDWRPAPILCDSNFLACSDAHFDRVIDRLKQADFREVDFNQALDARLLTEKRARRLAEVRITPRFSWDDAKEEWAVFKALATMKQAGVPLSRFGGVFCLVGHNETPDEAHYRLHELKEAGYLGFAMRYQPLDALERNAYLAPQWTERLMLDFCRYWNRQAWFGGITFEEYCEGQHDERQEALQI